MTPEDEELNRKLRERFLSMTQHFPTSADLSAAFERSKAAILAEVRAAFPAAEIHTVGPDKEERSDWWECYLEVDSDATRDSLSRDDLFMQRLKQRGEGGGFPPHLIEIESRETLRRDFQNNWFYRLR